METRHITFDHDVSVVSDVPGLLGYMRDHCRPQARVSRIDGAQSRPYLSADRACLMGECADAIFLYCSAVKDPPGFVRPRDPTILVALKDGARIDGCTYFDGTRMNVEYAYALLRRDWIPSPYEIERWDSQPRVVDLWLQANRREPIVDLSVTCRRPVGRRVPLR